MGTKDGRSCQVPLRPKDSRKDARTETKSLESLVFVDSLLENCCFADFVVPFPLYPCPGATHLTIRASCLARTRRLFQWRTIRNYPDHRRVCLDRDRFWSLSLRWLALRAVVLSGRQQTPFEPDYGASRRS